MRCPHDREGHPAREPRAVRVARRAVAALLAVAVLLPGGVSGAHEAGDGGGDDAGSGTGSPGTTSTTLPASEYVERRREIEERIRRLRDAIGEASAEEAELLDELSANQAELDELDARVAAIDGELAEANGRLAAAQAEVDRLDARYRALTREVAETNRAVDVAEDEVRGLAAELYRRAGGRETAAWTALALDAETPEDLFAASRYLSTQVARGRDRVAELSALRERLEAAREELEDERKAAREARDVVAEERARIAELRSRQEAVREQVAAAVARQRELLDEIKAKKAQFNAEIDALRAESNSIAGMLRERQSGQALSPGGDGVLALPVPAEITSPFGQRRHPILGTTRMHSGVDFSVGPGVPVAAAAGGEVVWAGPRGGYGNTVIIDHGNALATLYAHQSTVSVSRGQALRRGQVVGAVGSTGLSTGPHLHFEVRVRGTPVDPLQYL